MLEASVGDHVPPGVVRVPSTRWLKRAPDGRNANVLTAQRLADIGGGPSFYNCLIEVERCGD
jgi:anaerobic selenocysteine-containing dehydrogenase